MVKFIGLFALFMSQASFAHDGYPCPDNPKVSDFYGTYKVVKIIDGDFESLTTMQTKNIRNKTIVFSKEYLVNKSENSEYRRKVFNSKIFCHLAPYEEGEVPHHRWTTFFNGFGLGRKTLRFLNIQNDVGGGIYEIVNNQIWTLGPKSSLVIYERIKE